MAIRRTHRRKEAQLAFEALSIEGSLLSPEWLARVAALGAGGQSEAEYRVLRGLNLRDEIGRYWRIAQAHWNEFSAGRAGGAAALVLSERFVTGFLRDVLGFASLAPTAAIEIAERSYPIGHIGVGTRVPVVIAPAASGLETPSANFGDGSRRRNAFGLAQEFLNASDDALWGLACDGMTLRILRDNASLTRPAWIEADLARIFTEERYADFAALWLLAHETRFGSADRPPTDCPLETWRSAGREEGTRAREHLRGGVEAAVIALGQGFLSHADNDALRAVLQDGSLTKEAYFQQLLRLVYRMIFLLTVEERGVLHPETATDAAKALYAAGYSVHRLRERSVRRSAHDRFSDLWGALTIVFRGTARGEPRLGLPALAGLFAEPQCAKLDASKLENRSLLTAVFHLSWLREGTGLSRVNWRDMGPEELGSVYESLLELVPQITEGGRRFAFATGAETDGNARKLTGSYYTPDSLVQALIDSALEPVVVKTLAANPTHPVEALLQLAVVDPACGSGHFLLAAARRIAAHVARIRANGSPSAAEYRHALREVVGRCIYGVDLNDMAVELCKVSLWMEAVEPGRPLSFLDSHIQHGNSLLGATPSLITKGVPDEAWEPIEGDDKKVAGALRKQNTRERAELSLEFTQSPASTYVRLGAGARAVDEAADEDLAALESKGHGWQALVASPAYENARLTADLWCAAFVWRKESGLLRDMAPTDAGFRLALKEPARISRELRAEVARLRDAHHFFHWHLAFPQVFARGGFDVILSNPPWDRVTVEEKEWFAQTRPDISSAPTAARRRAMIQELEHADPELLRRFKLERRRVDGEKCFLCHSGRVPLSAQGILNTYPMFVEMTLDTVSTNGRIGIIVPTGIATAKGAGDLFRHVVDSRRLRSLRDMQNRRGIFHSVQRNMRFCLLTLGGDVSDRFIVSAQALTFEELHDATRESVLTMADVAAVNPDTHHLPLFTTGRDAHIVLGIYARNHTISQTFAEIPTRAVEFLRVLNTADDSGAFRPLEPSDFAGARSSSWLPVLHEGRPHFPLYEAKLLDQYNHRAATFVGTDRSKRYGLHAAATASTESQLVDPEYVSVPRYWVAEDVLPAELKSPFLLVYRDAVSAVADARCLSATLVPWGAVGDTLKVALCHGGVNDVVIMHSVLNSFLLDYVFRQKSSSSHASAFILKQLPMPALRAFHEPCKWESGRSLVSWLAMRQLELNYTAHDMAPFAAALKFSGAPFRWAVPRRADLLAEIDAAVFATYGATREDVSHILETFPIVKRRDEEAFGEYATKRRILECFDAIHEATRSGRPYESRAATAARDGEHVSNVGGQVP